MRHSAKGNTFLFLAALVWGFSLAAQKAGLNYLGPFTFTAIRCTVGGIVMLPLILFLEKRKPAEEKEIIDKKEVLKGAFFCGILVFTVILLQQFGLPYTSVGKAGFITALYILITPVIGMALGKKTGRNLWLGVAVGLAGMYLLCLFGGIEAINFGDVMMFIASFICAIHIHTIDHFVKKISPVKLTCSQFIFAGLLCVIPAAVLETVTWEAVKLAAVPIIYASVFSCAVGYTFQTIGQKLTNPNLACLIMSLETVFALLSGWIFFGEILSAHEYVGCMLMFSAIIISQLPEGRGKIKEEVLHEAEEDELSAD